MSLLKPLSLEEREDVSDLTRSTGWKPLMKLVDILVRDFDERVLSYNLAQGAERLTYLKAESEAARKLAQQIAQLKEHLRIPDNKQ